MPICPNDNYSGSSNAPCQCPQQGGIQSLRANFGPTLGSSGGLPSGGASYLPRQRSTSGAEGVIASYDYGFGYNWMGDDWYYFCPTCNPSDPAQLMMGGMRAPVSWDSGDGFYYGRGMKAVFASNDHVIRAAAVGASQILEDGSIVEFYDLNSNYPGRFKRLLIDNFVSETASIISWVSQNAAKFSRDFG